MAGHSAMPRCDWPLGFLNTGFSSGYHAIQVTAQPSKLVAPSVPATPTDKSREDMQPYALRLVCEDRALPNLARLV
jgi:hypothetical protein